MLAWIDLEMTGLDPQTDLIIEIATIVTDDDLNIVDEGPDLVVGTPTAVLDSMAEVVVKMHESSGLTKAAQTSDLTIADAESQTLDFLKKHIAHSGIVPLCGNSIGMDRRFLAAQMPKVENFLHYRSVDVSTIKELARRWRPEALHQAPKKEADHRALADIKESINELRHYRNSFFDLGKTD